MPAQQSIKEQVAHLLNEKLKDTRDGIRNPDRRHNNGPTLFEIHYWQEVCALAEKKLKEAWKEAEESGILKDDDYYRNTLGETIAAESEHFSCLVKVAAGRKSIDKEAFLTELSTKLRRARPWFEEIWELNQKESKASLSKRVLEV